VIPAFDCFCGPRFRRNDSLSIRSQLPECLAMAVIWFILGNNHHIRFVYFGEVLDASWNHALGDRKPWSGDHGGALHPGINQDAVSGIRIPRLGRRRLCFWGEEKEEAAVCIEVLDCDRHGGMGTGWEMAPDGGLAVQIHNILKGSSVCCCDAGSWGDNVVSVRWTLSDGGWKKKYGHVLPCGPSSWTVGRARISPPAKPLHSANSCSSGPFMLQ
jgi:hypothetical protein